MFRPSQKPNVSAAWASGVWIDGRDRRAVLDQASQRGQSGVVKGAAGSYHGWHEHERHVEPTVKELFTIVEESPGQCRVYVFGHGFAQVGPREDAERAVRSLNGDLRRWLDGLVRPEPQPAPAPVVAEPDLPPIASITAVTSLSPDPAQAARQRECVASWLAAGCKVVALQVAADAITDDEWPTVTIVRVPPSRTYPHLVPIATMAQWIEANVPKDDAAMIVNADIDLLIGAEALFALAHEASNGLTYVHRHESNGERCQSGIDAFIFRSEAARLIPRGDVLVMGKPYWDYMVPHSFLRARRPLCSPAFPVLRHVTHPFRWNAEQHTRAGLECVRLFGAPLELHTFAERTRPIGPIVPPTPKQQQQDEEARARDEEYAAAHPYGF